MLQRLRARPEWKFLAILPRANPFLAAVWWSALVVRSLLPALLAVAMGVLVGTVAAGGDLVWPLAGVGTVFVLRKRRASMSSTEPARPADDMPAALPSMWRALRRGFDAEPALLTVAFALSLLAAR